MPPDGPERSELDEALFSSDEPEHTPTRGAGPDEAHEDLSELNAELFGEVGPDPGGDAAAIPPDGPRRRRARRFGLGALIVLLVVGLGGLAYATFGSDDDTPTNVKIEVRGSEVTRTTRRTSTTSSTTATSTTTSTTTTTTTAPPATTRTPPATTRAPVVIPETNPPVVEPPVTDPPPPITEPPTTPPTEPPTTPPTEPPTTAA